MPLLLLAQITCISTMMINLPMAVENQPSLFCCHACGSASHRYFNASSRRMPTLALGGLAPIAVSFISANDTDTDANGSATPAAAAAAAATASDRIAAMPVGSGTGILRVNLQTCSSTDTSASNGVLHILSSLDGGDDASLGGSGDDDDGAGAVVPDVLELTYAFGFRKTYEAIVAASSDGAESGVGFAPAAVAPAAETAAVPTTNGTADEGGATTTIVDALRGPAAHTLLAVGDSRLGNAISLGATVGKVVSERVELSVDTLR